MNLRFFESKNRRSVQYRRVIEETPRHERIGHEGIIDYTTEWRRCRGRAGHVEIAVGRSLIAPA